MPENGKESESAQYPLFLLIPKKEKWMQKFLEDSKRKNKKNGNPEIPIGMENIGLGKKVYHHIPPHRTSEFYTKHNIPYHFLLLPVYDKPHNKHHGIYNHRNLTESISCILNQFQYSKIINPNILEKMFDVCRSNCFGLPDSPEKMSFQNGELKNFTDEYSNKPAYFVFQRLFQMWGNNKFFVTQQDQQIRDDFLKEIQRITNEAQEFPTVALFKLSATIPVSIQY